MLDIMCYYGDNIAMASERNANEQVAFRIELALSKAWKEFLSFSLIPNRTHHACAMLLYMWASPEQRDLVQRAYARFQRDDELQAPAELGLHSGDLSAGEVEILTAFRGASSRARQQALSCLQGEGGAEAT
jgi:hypothetical protein